MYTALMRVRIKGKGPHGEILDEFGEVRRTRKSLIQNAKDLRSLMTPAEKMLWKRLRGKKMNGYKFYRQVPIDRFVVDFYCPEKKLIVELDGEIHDREDVKEHDKNREEVFLGKGLRTIRFRNEEVFKNMNGVCEQIVKNCEFRLS